MPKYKLGPIPIDIQEQLAQVFDCRSLRELKGLKFRSALQMINEKLKNYTPPGTSPLTHRKPFVFYGRSLHRYFNNEPIRLDKLQALLFFLGYQPDQYVFDNNKSRKNKPEPYLKNLSGKWYSYVYEGEEKKVQRTALFLKQTNQIFEVHYRGIYEVFTGKAEIIKNSIFFYITSEDREIKICLCAELPDNINRAEPEQFILNVYCLANSRSGRPVISNVIMVKADKLHDGSYSPEAENAFKNTGPVSLDYQQLSTDPKKISPGATMEEWKEREIISYLSRNSRVNKKLRGFSPNTFEHIKDRNNTADERNDRDNYYKLKVKLQGFVGYSFSRYRQRSNEVAVFSYTFKFSDEERKCTAFRHPIGNPAKDDFKGEVTLKAEKIYLLLTDPNLQRRRQFIAPFNAERNETTRSFVFRGITSTISSQTAQPIALRELILCLPEKYDLKNEFSEEDKINNYVTYGMFCRLLKDSFPDEEKMYLANQFASTLIYPQKSDSSFSHSRQDKARKYQGSYVVFILQPDRPPVRMLLTIDSLAQAILQVRHAPTGPVCFYYGIAEFYFNSIRISVHLGTEYPSDQRHSEFLSDPIREKNYLPAEIIEGINLTADDENKAQSSRFIMMRNESPATAGPGPVTIEEWDAVRTIAGIHP